MDMTDVLAIIAAGVVAAGTLGGATLAAMAGIKWWKRLRGAA